MRIYTDSNIIYHRIKMLDTTGADDLMDFADENGYMFFVVLHKGKITEVYISFEPYDDVLEWIEVE